MEILNQIGNFVSGISQDFLDYIAGLGYLTSPTTAKLTSILVILGLVYLVLHFVTAIKKPIKWGIIIIAGLLVISVLSTFI